MKMIVEDVASEGLESLLGKNVTLFCGVYIYTGQLVGVDYAFVKLANAKIVYETGELTSGGWKDAQPLPGDWYVMTSAVESFGILK